MLVHTTFGDLLRSLEPRESYGSPQNIVLSREALAAVHYQKGNIVTYTVNGKTMRHVNHSDNIHVRQTGTRMMYRLQFCKSSSFIYSVWC